MHFHIRHESIYRYDAPITLGPHVLRLTPRSVGIDLHSHRLVVEPEPSAWQREVDAFDNVLTRVCFSGTTQHLRIDSEFEIDTIAPLPLAPLLEPLPQSQSRAVRHGPKGQPHPAVEQFAESLATEVDREPVAFLDRLSQTLYTRFDRHIRPHGNARPAHETLALRSGACRDLTTLFLESCRTFGLAGRFVSGYQARTEATDGRRHLHAWAEVLLPGIGWHGWDATHGTRVSDSHVALFAAPSQSETMPVDGSYFFDGSANCLFEYSVHIEATAVGVV